MKKIIFVTSAVLLLAAGCGKSASVQSDTSVTTQSANQPASSSTSLKALITAGTSQKCTVTYGDTGAQSQGTIYVSNGKMRGDFTSQVNGAAQTSHMINDGTTVYTWIDGSSMAMKMAISATQTAPSPTGTAAHQNIDQNANYQYNCSPWTVDSSVLTPPSNINFTDMSAMMNNGTSGSAAGASASASASASMKAQECGACDSAGASKAQCLAALHC